MSLTTLGEVPRPVSRFSIVAVARISGQLIFQLSCWTKKVDQTEPPFLSTVSFLTTHLKMRLSEILATATLEQRKLDLGTSPRVLKTHSEKRRLDFLALRAKTNLKPKNLCLQPQKKSPA